MRLEGKVSVVTGATAGIGLGVAQRFAQEGAKLILNARRGELLEEVAAGLRDSGAEVTAIAGDVADPATADALAAAARDKYGRVDVAVLNAGLMVPAVGNFWEVPPAEFDEIFNVNVRGVFLGARAVTPLMPSGSSIIVVGSAAAFVAAPTEAIYGASKAAVVQLAKGMAIDLVERGVRVNALCPGLTDTPTQRAMINEADDPIAMEAEFNAVAPMGRMGKPEEMAAAAVFLASDESSYTTGTTLVCDGGVMIQ
jgi:NAD(P)-dependent dehydrogenase (short-subunit alcohol dehydrogenase family)